MRFRANRPTTRRCSSRIGSRRLTPAYSDLMSSRGLIDHPAVDRSTTTSRSSSRPMRPAWQPAPPQCPARLPVGHQRPCRVSALSDERSSRAPISRNHVFAALEVGGTIYRSMVRQSRCNGASSPLPELFSTSHLRPMRGLSVRRGTTSPWPIRATISRTTLLAILCPPIADGGCAANVLPRQPRLHRPGLVCQLGVVHL